jgi:DNA-binding transcriptional regulator YdaS (Cro superfamily)
MKRKPLSRPAQLIKQYIETNSMNQWKFAELAEVQQGMVSQWIRDERPVSPKAALAIERNTDGALTRFDLCPKVFQSEHAA